MTFSEGGQPVKHFIALSLLIAALPATAQAATRSQLITEYKALRAEAEGIVDGSAADNSFVDQWYAVERKFQSEVRSANTIDPRGDWAEAETFLYRGVPDRVTHPNDSACPSIARANLHVADCFFRAAAYGADDSNPATVGDC